MTLNNENFNEKNVKSSVFAIKTICYGKEREWTTKEEAIKFFMNCLEHSEGSEHNRYLTVLLKIKQGLIICSDE